MISSPLSKANVPARTRESLRRSRRGTLTGTVGLLAVRAATVTALRVDARSVNERHLQILSSRAWAQLLSDDVLPWVTATTNLGDHLLEVGPGPGLTTDLLRGLVARVTAVEVDPTLAQPLKARMAGTNVTVLNVSAAALPFGDNTFSAAACFAVLHHVPSGSEQDQVLSEILRVLRPGGTLIGSDGYDDAGTRAAHADDTFVPLDPDQLRHRLEGLAFTEVSLDRGAYDYRFRACKPPVG